MCISSSPRPSPQRAQGDDNGTPLQKDEPYADNPVEGVVIYYWLKSDVSTAVTLEIADAQGKHVATIPATPKPRRRSRASTASSASRRSGR